MMPFSREGCAHQLRLRALGHEILLLLDNSHIAEILTDVFASRYFATSGAKPELRFYCSTRCSAGWDLAMDCAGAIFVCRATGEKPLTFERFLWTPSTVKGVGTFSANERFADCVDTTLELFASQFQHRFLEKLLSLEPSMRLIHTASIAHNGRGVLLLGATNGGKSTLSLAGVLVGMQFLSDDFSTIDIERGLVHPFPRALRLRKASCHLIPEFASMSVGTTVDVRGETRFYMHPENIRPDALGGSVRISHIIRLNSFSDRPEISPANPASIAVDCMKADIFDHGNQALDLMWQWAGLADGVTCLDLKVGSPMATAQLLRSFLEQA
ncbi:MAG: hypothetical protein ACLQDI_13945 [Syntrophobacteraceae bacterium]